MLKDDVKVSLRVSSDVFDAEIDGLIATAKADIVRAGVDSRYIADENTHPIVKTLIILWCKAMFGYDNSEAARFMDSYHTLLSVALNSPIGMQLSDGTSVSGDTDGTEDAVE